MYASFRPIVRIFFRVLPLDPDEQAQAAPSRKLTQSQTSIQTGSEQVLLKTCVLCER